MNKLILVGKIKFIDKKEKFTSFQISTRDGYGEHKQWNNHSCKVFGKTMDFISSYVNDDDIVEVVGTVSYNKTETTTYTNIIVSEIGIVSSSKKEEEPPF